MNKKDRELGMDREITRRDFLEGVAFTVAGAALANPSESMPDEPAAAISGAASLNYPPMKTGIRGQDPGAVSVGHSLRDGKRLESAAETGETYDLVIVGSGMSGLSAAYYFRREQRNARILIIDGCDDFGGHARRNEFSVDGRQLLINGGTSGIWYPGTFTAAGKALLQDVGIHSDRYYARAHSESGLYAGWGLRPAAFFNEEMFGVDRLVPGFPGLGHAPFDSPNVTPAGPTKNPATWQDFLARTPLSKGAKDSLLRIYTEQRDYLPGLTVPEKILKLRKMSYTAFLIDVAKVHPDTIAFIQYIIGGGSLSQGSGPESFSAMLAYKRGHGGFSGMGLPAEIRIASLVDNPSAGEHIFLPDGVAGVARLLIRSLIPQALPGFSMEDSIIPHVNYDLLDDPGNAVRIRLRSMVVRVRHDGEPDAANEVVVTYLQDNRPRNVRARAVILSCFHGIVPYLCPELPEGQRAALHMAVRKPRITTSVALRNLRAFEKLGAANIACPGSFFSAINLNQNPSLGPFVRGQSPADPAVISLRDPNRILEHPGLPPRDQWRAGRAAALAISFETFERNARNQLARALAGGGFDPARDIAGIMVNRWGHGYATGGNELYDPDWRPDELPWVKGRQRFGRIAIANSDSAGICLTQAAFEQSNRAVNEILNNVVRPMFDFDYAEWG
jgi:spermidine dehydrogenase